MSTSDSVGYEPAIKKLKQSIISDHVYDSNFESLVSKNWCNSNEITTDKFEIITKPFRVCRISNFLASERFLNKLQTELTKIEYRRTFTDLHQFEQSNDLKSVKKSNIKLLYKTFRTELTDWMKRVTRIELKNKISMSSSIYCDTDYLLCHDDNMGERKIAYILYYSPDWFPEYGGTLDLFDTDENGHPRNIVRSLLPKFNSLIFFEVTENSFHQVAEVLTKEKSRCSINGWFEGPIITPENNRLPRTPLLCKYIEPMDVEIILKSWINNMYMKTDHAIAIQKSIEENSYLLLSTFLVDNVYDKLSKEVLSKSINWRKVGPADERNYEVADETTLPNFWMKFYDMFKSKAFFDLLKRYTELDLVSIEPNMKPKMTIELQRWSQGCYTLIVDNEENVKDIKKSTIKNVVTVSKPSKRDLECIKKKLKFESLTDIENKILIDNSKELNSSKESNTSKDSAFSNKSNTNSIKSVSMKSSQSSENSESINFSSINADIERCKNNTSPINDNEYEDDEDEEEEKVLKIKKYKKVKSKNMQWRDPTSEFKVSPETDSSDNISIKMSNSVDRHYRIKTERDTEDEDEDEDEYDEYEYEDEEDEEEEYEYEEEEEEEEDNEDGSLDVIVQFHTENIEETNTIDYIEPKKKDGLCIQVPPKDNHICFVYKTKKVTRVHKYINHYCKGYFYNLICTYTE